MQSAMQPNVTIDVKRDLSAGSSLKDRLSNELGPAFAIAMDVAHFAGKPISGAVGSGPMSVSVTVPGQWKTGSGICFSLTPSSKCTLCVGKSSSSYSVAKGVRSDDTNNVSIGPVSGKVYINIDLDFDITGKVSGAGTTGGVCISGQASGSSATTFSYCHPVDANTETIAAIKDAFSRLILPFDPDCMLKMPVSSLARINFAGCLSFELNASYGLGSYKFSAPGADAAKQSLKVGMESFNPPGFELDMGASASFSYNHNDQFEAIITKGSATQATLYLLRAAKDAAKESAGVTAKISEVQDLKATIDQKQMSSAIDKTTKIPGAGAKVTPVLQKLQSSLVDRTNDWLQSKDSEASLTLTLAQQHNRTLLYSYSVDLSKADLVQSSWTQFTNGNITQAMKLGGMNLLPGSGVADEVKHSVCVDLHFFNLFKASDTSIYFKNSYTDVGPEGHLRYLYDIGHENEVDIRNAVEKCRFHFVATAVGGDNNAVQNAEVDLQIEMSESNDSKEAQKLAMTIAPLGTRVQAAQKQMTDFVAANKKGTLTLVCIFKPSAYARLTSSPYVSGKPPANPQAADARNFAAFHTACVVLEQWSFLGALNYPDWAKLNEYSNNVSTYVDNNPNVVPDRRNCGDPSAVPNSFFANREAEKANIGYYYENCAAFMNLCDELHDLSGIVIKLDADQTTAEWQQLLKQLSGLVKNSLDADFSKPAAWALLELCQGATMSTKMLLSANKQSLACTVTVS